ncbi:serine/threonine-protein kinase [Vitiosangium sp. GDMCC 1.1324]|uniref:serine/threonine protein kinase n=1 Tax=Vitiosangium sp. (strain GDMCC 1.1324) TaxID=2138576 RepID=UPI00130EB2FC|nr:serine/threonine-protein kinase [Vitiosangium sp. GDMCC 1.1324]
MLERASPQLAKGTNINGLVVEELVGVGGWGTVYRARREDGATYALKFIPLGHAVDRALREFAMLLRVRHRNLVQVVSLGVWPEEAPEYLCLQLGFVEGERLDVWWKKHTPDARGAAGKVLELARGLTAAHAAGVVHRDVKEANIIVRASDGEAVLVDFGSGTYEEAATLTRGPMAPGTPSYMAPEALRFAQEKSGKAGAHYKASPADDLYALGVILYRMATGKRPFEVREPGDEEAVLEEEAPAPHLLNPRVPGPLSAVCMRLLEKEPSARHASMAELCTVLEAQLAAADASWSVPLLEPVTQPGGPAPFQEKTPGAPRRARRRVGQFAALAGVAACLGTAAWMYAPTQAATPAAVAQVSGRPPPPMEAQASDAGVQHPLAAAPPTAEPPTAAVAPPAMQRKEDTMKKQPESDSKRLEVTKGSTGKVAGCTAVLFLAGACAGGGSLTRPPDDMACEAGSIEAMEKSFRIEPGGFGLGGVLGRNQRATAAVALSDGDSVVLTTLETLEDLPELSTLNGRVTFGAYESKPAAYFRFTRATSAVGRKESKVCMCAIAPLDSSGKVDPALNVKPVTRYYAGCGVAPGF